MNITWTWWTHSFFLATLQIIFQQQQYQIESYTQIQHPFRLNLNRKEEKEKEQIRTETKLNRWIQAVSSSPSSDLSRFQKQRTDRSLYKFESKFSEETSPDLNRFEEVIALFFISVLRWTPFFSEFKLLDLGLFVLILWKILSKTC